MEAIRTVMTQAFTRLRQSVLIEKFSSLLGWLAEFGTSGYDPETKRRLMIMNFIAYLVAFSTAGYAIQHIQLNDPMYNPLIVANIALVFTAIAVPLAHRINEFAGGALILVSEYLALFFFTWFLGTDSGVHLQYFIFGAATFVVFGLRRWHIVVPLILVALGLYIYAAKNFPTETAVVQADPEMLKSIYTQAAMTTMGLIAGCVFYAFRLVDAARAETDNLLRNILPDQIAERLKKSKGQSIADSFDDASILFADITGFVAIANAMTAEQVVEMLNRLISRFDALAKKHGVEKIKTIGDAYMAASGIPEPTDDHLERLALMAQSMQEAVSELRDETGIPLQIRVGIASGPVMAGVIGTQKFTYDVWGPTVNLAARLENKSTPGKVLICPNCFDKLQSSFELHSHGLIEIKGFGKKETWFLGNQAT